MHTQTAVLFVLDFQVINLERLSNREQEQTAVFRWGLACMLLEQMEVYSPGRWRDLYCVQCVWFSLTQG